MDAEAQFSLEAFEFPPKNDIQEQVESVLKKGINIPVRSEARLSSEEQDLLVRTTDYIEPVYEKENAPALKRKTRLKAK